jgi:hypothetical protein
VFGKLRRLFSPKTTDNKYRCTCCGKEHHDWPALAYDTPDHYAALSETDKSDIAYLDSDFCIINHPGQTYYFIRCVLIQDIIDCNEQLDYGLWVSLSQEKFDHYRQTFKGHNDAEGYFGWICNDLIGYERTLSIPADVYINNNGTRPEVVPHRDFDHPLVTDYYNGITAEEAHRRIEEVMNRHQ